MNSKRLILVLLMVCVFIIFSSCSGFGMQLRDETDIIETSLEELSSYPETNTELREQKTILEPGSSSYHDRIIWKRFLKKVQDQKAADIVVLLEADFPRLADIHYIPDEGDGYFLAVIDNHRGDNLDLPETQVEKYVYLQCFDIGDSQYVYMLTKESFANYGEYIVDFMSDEHDWRPLNIFYDSVMARENDSHMIRYLWTRISDWLHNNR